MNEYISCTRKIRDKYSPPPLKKKLFCCDEVNF